MIDITRFLDEKLRVKSWPAKKEMKAEVLRYISTKFEYGRFYTEKEVNEIINAWHTFGDYFLIRRGLFDHWLLTRTKNGARYWKEETNEHRDIIELITLHYNIGDIKSLFRLSSGFGSNSYYILTDMGEYILRDIQQIGINHPESEAAMPLSEIYPTISGDSILKVQDKDYNLYKFMDKKV